MQQADLRHTPEAVFALLDRELWLVTTRHGEQRGGLIATFVSKASIVPELPRMAIGLAKQHHTCGLIQASGRFAMHLLWLDQIDLVWRFGLRSGHNVDKLASLTTRESPLGNPLLDNTLGWLDCRVEATLDIGDRLVFVAEVCHGGAHGQGIPLTVNRLYFEAPEDRREELDRMYERDGRVDAATILAWRTAEQ
jgi:flavin reductase (DIM6/NTAB) family NADH-FMN oxidoreductase RutF